MRKILIAILAAAFALCSCISPSRKIIEKASDLGPDEVLVAGKIIVHPAFADKEQELSGEGADYYRGVLLVLNRGIYKRINPAKTQNLTGREFDGRLTVKPGETFYAAFPAGKPIYLLTAAFCTKYYYVRIPGTTQWINNGTGMMMMMTTPDSYQLVTKFEHIPLNYKVDIKPGNRAVNIGEIHVYRDDFNKITRIEVKNAGKQADDELKAKFGGLKFIKLLAKAAPDSELIQPTEADNFLSSGFRLGGSAGYASAIGAQAGFAALDIMGTYQFSRNLTAEALFGVKFNTKFFSFDFVSADLGDGVTLGMLEPSVRLGVKYFVFDGTFSPYALARLGAAFDMDLNRGFSQMFRFYFLNELGAGIRWSLDTQFDICLEAGMELYNFKPALLIPKLVLTF